MARILILQQRGWAIKIGHFLAQRLHGEGHALAALTFKKSTDRFVRKQGHVPYEMIVSHDAIMDYPPLHGSESVTLDQVCTGLALPTIWPTVQTLRYYIRSYGERYFYGYRQNVSDEGIAQYVKAAYARLSRLLEEFRPDLILTPNFVSLPHIMLYHLARQRGVRMIGVTDTKVSGIYAFTYSPYDDEGPFIDRIERLNQGLAVSTHADRAREYIAEYRREFKKPTYETYRQMRGGVAARVKAELLPYVNIVRYCRNRLLGEENRISHLHITADYKTPRVLLRDHYVHKIQLRAADAYPYAALGQIREYAYLPLQFQPEASIDVMAPWFNHQPEIARLAAQSLPGDMSLVVKDHPSMIGRRPRKFYEKLARTPNVKLVDYRLPSPDVIKGARIVLSPSSTSVAEAAFYSKPAIQFGMLGTTLRLPNVVQHTDFTTLADRIRKMIARDYTTEDYERRLMNFVAAAYDAGFQQDYHCLWEGVAADSGLDALWQIYSREIHCVLEGQGK